MKLEDQVVSLELAKKMKELGFEQESLCYWWKFSGWEICYKSSSNVNKKERYVYSAYTVAELIEIAIKDSNIVWKIYHGKNGWVLYSAKDEFGFQASEDFPTFVDNKIEDCFAKLAIYLKENSLI